MLSILKATVVSVPSTRTIRPLVPNPSQNPEPSMLIRDS